MPLFSPARRRALTAVLATSFLALSACASPESSEEKSSPEEPLVIVLNAALASIDPVKANSQRTEGNVLTSVYSTLTRVNPEGELEGDLATEWSSPDPNTWDFTIRTGVTFTNGDPLGATEVAEGIKRFFDPDLGAKGSSAIPSFKDVTAVGDDHVVITTTSPNFQVPWSVEQFYLIDPAYVADHDISSEAVGSGPYSVESYDPQGEIKLVRNDDYYGDAPAYENVTFRVIADEAARIAAVKAGEVDIVASLDPQSLEQLESEDSLEVGAVEGLRTHFILFNQREEPFSNKLVREAVNYAVDKESITKTIYKGLVEPGVYINEGTPGYDPDQEPFAYDPDKAKQLLAEAGYPDGFSTEILNAPGAYAGDDLTVQAIAEQLGKVGIKVSIKNLPYTTYLEYVLNQNGKTAYPLNFRSYAGSSAATLVGRYVSYKSGGYGFQDDPEYDELLAEAQAATTEEAQEAAYQKVNDRLYDQAALLYLFNEPQTYAYKKSVVWVPRGEQWLRPYDVTPAS